jgi:hypothetical protein
MIKPEVFMKTRRAALLITITLLLCIVVVIYIGCGASGTAYMGDPMALFTQAQENLLTASSFRMTGEIGAEYNIPPEMGSQNQQLEMLFEQKAGAESIIKIKMAISGEGTYWSSEMPDTFEFGGYIVGERAYIQDPYSGEWYYEEEDLGGTIGNFGQSLSAINAQTVMDMVDASKSVEVIEENDDSITYKLILDIDEYLGDSFEEEVAEEFRQRGATEEEISRYLQATRNLISTMEIVIEVEKKSGRISRFGFSSDENIFEIMEPMFTYEPLPEGARMTMYADFRFSEYGKRFDLELPPETRDAVPFESSDE